MRTAVVTDSNSGIFKEEAEQLGIYVIPMPVIVEGRTCFENEDITSTEFFSAMAQNKEVSSSQPSPGILIKKWKALLEEWDEVIYIPMSSGLSGSTQAAQVLALQSLAPEDMRAETVLLLQNAEQQVLGADVGVAQLAGGGARGLNGDLRPLGKFFVASHRASLPWYNKSIIPRAHRRKGRNAGSSEKYRQNQSKI